MLMNFKFSINTFVGQNVLASEKFHVLSLTYCANSLKNVANTSPKIKLVFLFLFKLVVNNIFVSAQIYPTIVSWELKLMF